MAFTSAAAVQVRKYLGYPQLNRYKDVRLENAISIIGDDADASAEVTSVLATLVIIEASLANAQTTAGLKRAEEVEWYQATGNSGSAEIEGKRSEGRRFCSRLSQLFGVPLWGDAFGTAGYPGDSFMGPGMQQSGGPIPLG